ncbi:MAG: carboxymuconolactone decarboxylase family protein [Halopseudomonas sp.]
MPNPEQQALYDAFYRSTHNNQHLDQQTELLIGLAVAIALDCQPCSRYYLNQAKQAGLAKEQLAEVQAKVMAVAAGQKRLQSQALLDNY